MFFGNNPFEGMTGIWDAIDFSVLWFWLPGDIQTVIGACLVFLFLLAIKRVFF